MFSAIARGAPLNANVESTMAHDNDASRRWTFLGEVLPAFLGAAVGSGITLLGAIWFVPSQEAKTWCNALTAEVSALTSVVRGRKLIELIDAKIKETEKSRQTRFPDFPVKGQYFTMYQASAVGGKLGLLGKDTGAQFARFYIFATSATEDLNYMAEANPKDVAPDKALAEMRELRAILEQALSIGESIAKRGDCAF